MQPIFTGPSEAQYQAYLQCRAHELALQAQQNYNSAITAINNEFTTNATGNFAVMPGFQTPIQTGAAAGYYSMFSKRTAISNVSFPSQPVQPSQVLPMSSQRGRASTKQLEQWQWPNQTMVFDVPEINLHKGMPHFRWALCHIDTSKPTKDGTQRRKYYCLGCYKCPTPTQHYSAHWQQLFQSYGDEVNDSWNTFTNVFPGVTMDWSAALGAGFIDALLNHAHNNLGAPNVTESDIKSFCRKCDVHFKRSVSRIVKNGAVVDPNQVDDFHKLVAVMTSPKCDFPKFQRTCYKLAKDFPNAVSWLKWHLNPKHAQNFFPPCQDFDETEMARFGKLSSSTNAQENLGKQFQEQTNFGKKMTIYEATDNMWKFQNRRKTDREATRVGQPSRYG